MSCASFTAVLCAHLMIVPTQAELLCRCASRRCAAAANRVHDCLFCRCGDAFGFGQIRRRLGTFAARAAIQTDSETTTDDDVDDVCESRTQITSEFNFGALKIVVFASASTHTFERTRLRLEYSVISGWYNENAHTHAKCIQTRTKAHKHRLVYCCRPANGSLADFHAHNDLIPCTHTFAHTHTA